MRIVVITLTRNEQISISFFIRHYQQIADHIIVYDSLSVDNTLRIVQEMSLRCCTTEVRDGYAPPLNDVDAIAIKNTAYKSITADWFIVVDCDELIYHSDLRGYLERCDEAGVTMPKVLGYQMLGDAIPTSGLLTDHIKHGVRDPMWDKLAVFKPSVDIRYDPGAHTANPIDAMTSQDAEIKLLHYKWLSREYVKQKAAACVIADVNHQNGYGYTNGMQNKDLWVRQYDFWRARRVRVIK
jgi:glycosyltransferase involved in cell wall biosynthesis